MRGKENTMFNMVQGFATRDRIKTCGMSNTIPCTQEIREIPLSCYLPNEEDEKLLREELIVHCCIKDTLYPSHFRSIYEGGGPEEYSTYLLETVTCKSEIACQLFHSFTDNHLKNT